MPSAAAIATPNLPGLAAVPRRSRSVSAIAREAGVSRRVLYDLLDEADAPGRDAAGLWDVDAVLEYVEERRGEVEVGGRTNPEIEKLKADIYRAKLRDLEWQHKKRAGGLIEIGDHLRDLRLVIDAVKSVFVSIPQSVALVTTDGEIRRKVASVVGEAERQCMDRLRAAVEAAREAGEEVGA